MIGPHRFRRKLADGQPAIGAILNFNSPAFVDLCALMGFDWVLIDCEHGPMAIDAVEGMIRAAEAGDISPIVRVPANVPHDILRFLDLGAAGVQVPHIESAEEARAAVAASRYPPLGTRGLAMTTRAAGYGADLSVTDYVERTNREVAVLAMLESATGVANIDTIAAVDGVDAIVIGPGDLSSSMGFGGVSDVPAVQDAIDRVIASSKAHGKPVSLPASSPASARLCIQRGADIVQIGIAPWLVPAGRAFLSETRRPGR